MKIPGFQVVHYLTKLVLPTEERDHLVRWRTNKIGDALVKPSPLRQAVVVPTIDPSTWEARGAWFR